MSDASQADQPAQMVAMSYRDLASILILGGITGLFVWGVGQVLNRYVFDVLFCQNASGSMCADAMGYAEGTALLAGGILALAGLIRLRTYRPLLVVLSAAISLWGLMQLAWGLEWYWGLPIAICSYLLAYGLYAWVARIRVFWIALVAAIVLVVAVRLALTL